MSYFSSAQGDTVFARISSTLQDLLVCFQLVCCSPRLHIPLTSIPAPFRSSESESPEIAVLATKLLDVGVYLEHLLESDTSSFVLSPSASCSISRANKLYGFPDPCSDPLVKNILEAGVWNFTKPVVKKEPITSDMINMF